MRTGNSQLGNKALLCQHVEALQARCAARGLRCAQPLRTFVLPRDAERFAAWLIYVGTG